MAEAPPTSHEEEDIMHGHSGSRGFGSRLRSSSSYRRGGWGRSGWEGWGTSSASDDDAPDPQLISSVQSCLAQLLGSWVPQSGRLGRATRHALRRFQVRQGLPASGYPDNNTVAQLRNACSGRQDSGDQNYGDSMQSVSGELPHWLSATITAAEEKAAIRSAIQKGERNTNKLTDLIFFRRHPERGGRRIQQGESALVNEWLDIQAHLVLPELQAPAQPAAPRPPAQAAPVPPAAHPVKPPSTTSGIEADGDTTNLIQCISEQRDQGRGISFVQRYLRDLARNEVAALHRAGFVVVSCFEEGGPNLNATMMRYFTRAQGSHDGRRGFTQAQAVGQTANTPVYFAVDADPDPRQRQAILDYVQGLADGHAQYLADMQAQNKQVVTYAIGIYGSGCVLDWVQAQGNASFFWQAFAPGWCNNRATWLNANIHTFGLDTPERCHRRFGHLEGWGNEGGW